jgi:predicted HAD superfamily Cof-like phosphohydrolase
MESIEQVKQFMTIGGQPTPKRPLTATEIHTTNAQRMSLRFRLILEELQEIAVAMGKEGTFLAELKKLIPNEKIPYDVAEVDLVEVRDGFADLRYVCDGFIIEMGLDEYFEKDFNEVHKSNMSKFCDTEEEAHATIDHYIDKGIVTFYEKVEDKYVVYRESDNKILKSVNFIEPTFESVE